MKTYTINTKDGGAVLFSLCQVHEQSGLSGGGNPRVKILSTPEGAVCEVCRQDRIRAAIRSVGSVVA